jgi:Uma2 family endonuclease
MDMTLATTGRMTAEEFYEWCHRPEERDRHYELERGKVVEVSRPGEAHGVICLNVSWALGGYIRQRCRGYACSNDTGIVWEHDPDTVRGPDVVFYDEHRSFADLSPKYTEQVPRLAVEILSPTDRPNKVIRRIAQFLKWGVALVWLIDPEERTVTVYRQDRAPEIREAEEELTGGSELPDFRCRVEDFFFMPGQSPPAPPV